MVIFQNYIDVFTRKTVHKQDNKRRNPQPKGVFKNTKETYFLMHKRCISL